MSPVEVPHHRPVHWTDMLNVLESLDTQWDEAQTGQTKASGYETSYANSNPHQ